MWTLVIAVSQLLQPLQPDTHCSSCIHAIEIAIVTLVVVSNYPSTYSATEFHLSCTLLCSQILQNKRGGIVKSTGSNKCCLLFCWCWEQGNFVVLSFLVRVIVLEKLSSSPEECQAYSWPSLLEPCRWSCQAVHVELPQQLWRGWLRWAGLIAAVPKEPPLFPEPDRKVFLLLLMASAKIPLYMS